MQGGDPIFKASVRTRTQTSTLHHPLLRAYNWLKIILTCASRYCITGQGRENKKRLND